MFNEKNMMNSAEQSGGDKESIKNRFNDLVSGGNYEEAEKVLSETEAREKESLQRSLFQAYYKEKNWEGVVRIINATEDPFSQKGRINRFKELAGEKFKEFESQIVFKEIGSSEAKEIIEIKSTLDFRELLKQKDYDRAQEWIDEIVSEGKYKDLTGKKLEDFINDRKRDIRQAKENK